MVRMGTAAFDPDATLFAFRPDAERACLVEARVRSGLADSLAATLQALGDDRAAAGEDLIARIRAGPTAPIVFGAYTDLVEAIFSDDIYAAERIADELCTPAFGHVGALRIVTLIDQDLGDGQAARYRRLVDDDPQLGLEITALAPPEFASAASRVSEAIALLDAAAPELAAELRTLVHEVVVVGREGDSYFGASSFQLWGALFVKLTFQASRVEIAQALAHECAHALLFGFGMGMPLVENEAEELYPSPLRNDPRPMDGVVHATYVIARMHYTMERLLESGLLTDEEEREAADWIERNAQGYGEGVVVVERDARWTQVGESVFRSAKDYMGACLHRRDASPVAYPLPRLDTPRATDSMV